MMAQGTLSGYSIEQQAQMAKAYMAPREESPSTGTTATVRLSSGPKNSKGAVIGTMTVSSPRGKATVPIVSGAKGYPAISSGTYQDCPTVPSKDSPTASDILTDENHGGGNSTFVRIIPKEGILMHQTNNQTYQDNAMTHGCVGVTAIRGSGTTAQENKAVVDNIIKNDPVKFDVSY